MHAVYSIFVRSERQAGYKMPPPTLVPCTLLAFNKHFSFIPFHRSSFVKIFHITTSVFVIPYFEYIHHDCLKILPTNSNIYINYKFLLIFSCFSFIWSCLFVIPSNFYLNYVPIHTHTHTHTHMYMYINTLWSIWMLYSSPRDNALFPVLDNKAALNYLN